MDDRPGLRRRRRLDTRRPSPWIRISASTINQLAYSRAKAGRFEEAQALFDRYAAISPGDANPLDSIAELYVRTGRLDLAEAKYKEALEMKPDFFTSCAGLTYVACLREDYAGAYRWIDELTARAPTPAAKAQGAWLAVLYDYLLGRWTAALGRFAGFSRQAEAAGVPYYAAVANWITGFILRDMGRSEDALAGLPGASSSRGNARSVRKDEA